MIKGHITICKVFNDGTKETVLDKHNLVTAGLGLSLANILTGDGSIHIEDYTPRYFQVGTSSIGFPTAEVSSYFYQLSAPLEWSGYGPDSDIQLEKRYRSFLASSTDGVTYEEHLQASSVDYSSVFYSGTDQFFGTVKPDSVTKYFLDSFASEIVLDENSGNGNDISEVGLFLRNPIGAKEDSPLLVAYKTFDAIPKTEEFSLVFHWSVGFIGQSNTIDRYNTQGGDRNSQGNGTTFRRL